jgi:AcrR family transcriptional regulator
MECRVSPQRSNRDQLVDGALRCLERLPAERVTARVIADESGANLASIGYHFGSKEDLITTAVIEGLDRWLAEIEQDLSVVGAGTPAERYRRARAVLTETQRRHAGLVQNFFAAIAKAPHDPRVRERLALGIRRTRPAVANLLGLGDDQAGIDAGALVLALFDGLLLQWMLDPELVIDGRRFDRAQRRLLRVLPTEQ